MSTQGGLRDQGAHSQIEQSVPEIVPLPEQQEIEPANYKRPCQGTAEDRQSDLCAQWNSADWTKIGSIAAIFGIGALLYQIYLTIQAVEDTGKATRAMERQNEIAWETKDKQLRPYVSFTEPDERPTKPFTRDGRMVFRVKNFGQTPADDVKLFYGSEFVDKPVGWPTIKLPDSPEVFGKLSPGDFRDLVIWLDDMTDDEIHRVTTGKSAVMIRLKLAYELPSGETDGDDVTLWLDQKGWAEGYTRMLSRQDRERS